MIVSLELDFKINFDEMLYAAFSSVLIFFSMLKISIMTLFEFFFMFGAEMLNSIACMLVLLAMLRQ